MEKILVWVSCLWFVSRPPSSEGIFEKFTVELVLKSLSGRNKSLEAPVFGFSNSLPYDLEESRE